MCPPICLLWVKGSLIKQSVPKLPLKAPAPPALEVQLCFYIKSQSLAEKPSAAHRRAVWRFSLGVAVPFLNQDAFLKATLGSGMGTGALSPPIALYLPE